MSRSFRRLAVLTGVFCAACSESGHSQFENAGGGSGAGGGAGTLSTSVGGSAIINLGDASLPSDDGGGSGPSPVVPCNGPCTDFPAMPIVAGDDAGAMPALPA